LNDKLCGRKDFFITFSFEFLEKKLSSPELSFYEVEPQQVSVLKIIWLPLFLDLDLGLLSRESADAGRGPSFCP
jgi:hypothetical protein